MTVSIENLVDKDIFDADDLLVIENIEKMPLSSREKWAHDDFKKIYKKIKKILLHDQDTRCFYCQEQNLNSMMDDWHIDHIVPIDEDDRFTFCDRNFVVACKGCNRLKNDKPVLVKKPITKAYSKSAMNYRIVHPRFDTYSLNIDIVAGMFYIGKTPKGRRTVHDCVLDRFLLAYSSNIKSSNRDFVEGALRLLFSEDPKFLINFIKSFP
jgi:hypothetical protein